MRQAMTWAVIALLAMVLGVRADSQELLPTKDLRMMCHAEEQDYNGGQSTRLRTTGLERSGAEFPVMDFDHTALKAYLEQNKGKKIQVKLVLVIREVAGIADAPVKLEAAAVDSTVDWNEGEGSQVKAKKGEACFSAAQLEEKKWTGADGKEVANFQVLVQKDGQPATLVNSQGADVAKDAAEKSVEIPFDEAFLKHLATDANCRGLFLFLRDKTARVDIFSREQTAKAPKLVLSAE